MIQIGAFRAWMKKRIAGIKQRFGNPYTEKYEYNLGYIDAMEDVAEHMGFPLDDREWEKWSP